MQITTFLCINIFLMQTFSDLGAAIKEEHE